MKDLYITEIFFSIQGESSFSGLPTSFIRLSGCNLRCSWCDTEYSFSRGKKMSVSEVSQAVQANPSPYVCITGGEPLLQEAVYNLMSELADKNYQISLETSGSISCEKVDPRVVKIIDFKCPGSAMAEKNDFKNVDYLLPHDEVKFVLKDREDFDYAIDVIKKYQLDKKLRFLLLSPVFEALEAKELSEWILKESLPLRLNLQVHKFIWDKNLMGV